MAVSAYTKSWQAWALLSPTLAVIAAFLYYPAVRTVQSSLYRSGVLGIHQTYVGLANFATLATSPDYRASIAVTVVFAVVVVAGTLAASFLLAVLIDTVTRGRAAYLVAAIWPYALPPAVAGTVLLFLLHPTLGVVSGLVESAGIPFDWFSNGPLALCVVALAAIWKQLGYNVVFFLAALNGVPGTLDEAAALDGVPHWRVVASVYVPLISPTLAFLVVMDTIYAFFGSFVFVDLMTQGGPTGSTNLLIFELYRDAFRFHDQGLASAESVVLFCIVAGLTYVQLRVSDSYAHYGS